MQNLLACIGFWEPIAARLGQHLAGLHPLCGLGLREPGEPRLYRDRFPVRWLLPVVATLAYHKALHTHEDLHRGPTWIRCIDAALHVACSASARPPRRAAAMFGL